MTLNRMLAIGRWTSGCVIAVLGFGCAQIFGFDKVYEIRSGGSGGAGGGSGGEAGGGSGASGGGEGVGGEGGSGGEGVGGEGGSGEGAGGEGGSGGKAPECMEPTPLADITEIVLIDDMEDDDGAITPIDDEVNPRRGFWFAANDSLGKQTPAPNESFFMSALELPRGDSALAARSEADDQFSEWGALFGFRLNSGSSGTHPGFYDASEFTGITFYAYAAGDSYNRLLVDIVDVQTSSEGGICNDKQGGCDDHFGRNITLTNCWAQYKVPFSQLKQGGWGQEFDQVDLTQVWGIQFRFGAGRKFDMWVDDVAFYK